MLTPHCCLQQPEHGIPEWFGLEGTSKPIQSHGQEHLPPNQDGPSPTQPGLKHFRASHHSEITEGFQSDSQHPSSHLFQSFHEDFGVFASHWIHF